MTRLELHVNIRWEYEHFTRPQKTGYYPTNHAVALRFLHERISCDKIEVLSSNKK